MDFTAHDHEQGSVFLIKLTIINDWF